MSAQPDKPGGVLEWKGWWGVVPLCFVAVAITQPGARPPPPSTTAEAPAAPPMTRDELRRWAPGKTKQQVRERFGTPMTVREDGGHADWVYGSIAAVDPSSGASAHLVTFHFSGTDGMDYNGKAEYAEIDD